jgi:hypothetical protein
MMSLLMVVHIHAVNVATLSSSITVNSYIQNKLQGHNLDYMYGLMLEKSRLETFGTFKKSA